jgi:hypothetical protein
MIYAAFLIALQGGADGHEYKARDRGLCKYACSDAAGFYGTSRIPRERNGVDMPRPAATADGLW